MDALRPAPGDADVETLSAASAAASRSAACSSARLDLLLLDEPTNHLDAESVAWLEKHLEDYKGTVVAVTHDRYFLDNVAGLILELDRGRGLPSRATTRPGSSSRAARPRRTRESRACATDRARARGVRARRRGARRSAPGRSATRRLAEEETS